MSFTIVNRHGESLLDLDAIHAEQRAEWVDGLGALMGRGEMKSVESEAYVKVHTYPTLSLGGATHKGLTGHGGRVLICRSLLILGSRFGCWTSREMG